MGPARGCPPFRALRTVLGLREAVGVAGVVFLGVCVGVVVVMLATRAGQQRQQQQGDAGPHGGR